MSIQYIKYNQINKEKWNHCIAGADNRRLYAFSYYLDAMADNWDALILNDYEYVMPLTWRKKYTVQYLYQPAFTAQLGLFGKNVDADLVNQFLLSVPAKFKYWDFYLNHGNHFKVNDFELYERMNYVLNLNDTYEKLNSNYRDNIKRNIKKCWQLNCELKKDFPVADVIKIAKEQFKSIAAVTEGDYNRFNKLYEILHQEKRAITYGITSQNELVASCVFFIDDNRAYYILVGNHPNGKTIGASHALIDAFIKDHAGKNLLLDFEGSDISNLAFFYNSFGAVEEKFAGIRLNRLPKLVQLIKK